MMDLETERRLVDAARSGDVGARNQLVEKLLPLIRQICRRELGSWRSWQEDAVQYCVIEALRSVSQVDHTKGTVSGFMRTRLRWACKDFLRSNLPAGCRVRRQYFRHTVSIFQSETDGGASYLDSVRDEAADEERAGVESEDFIRGFASQFDSRTRRLVELRYLHGFTNSQAGNAVGVCEGRTSKLIKRALNQARTWVDSPEQWPGHFRRRSVRMSNGDAISAGNGDHLEARERPRQKTGAAFVRMEGALDVIFEATAEDLEVLDVRIADAEQSLAVLKGMRKLIEHRLGLQDTCTSPPSARSVVGRRIEEYVQSHPGALAQDVKQALALTNAAFGTAIGRSRGRLRVVDGRVEIDTGAAEGM